MENSPEKADMGLFCVIGNYALGSRILKIAKEAGVTGGTVILGKGTMRRMWSFWSWRTCAGDRLHGR